MRTVLIPSNRLDEFIRIAGLEDHRSAISLGNWKLPDGKMYTQLPRWIDRLYHHPQMKIDNFPDEATPVDIQFNWALRDYQEQPMEDLKDSYTIYPALSGILHARPGAGKTVMAAYISSFVKKKVLVVLDNSTLTPQWEEAFLQATNVKSIGRIQGEKFDVDHDVVVAMVQTLMNRAQSRDAEFIDAFRKAGFGVVFFDECHKSACAEKYAKSTILMNRIHNLVGLTATPPIPNSTHELMLTHNIGPVISTMKGQEEKPTLAYIHYRSSLDKKQVRSVNGLYTGWTNRDGTQVKGDYVRAVAKYDSQIAGDPHYLNIIARASNHLISQGHRVIVIVKTIKQIDAVCASIKQNFPNLTPTPFHAKKPNIDRSKDNLIVATQKKASAGFDYKELSGLILATPMKGRTSLIQTGGRIMRSCAGKVQPIIYDLMDHTVKCMGPDMQAIKENVFMNEYGTLEVKNYNDITMR